MGQHAGQKNQPTSRQRKILIVVLGVCLLVLFLVLAAQNAFRLNSISPANTGEIFLFTALSGLAFLLFVAVLVLLARNVLKIYADQRSRVLGSRLRTRMLVGALLISFAPILFMFLFSYQLMNRAVDRWFTQPVTQMRNDSSLIALDLSRYAATNARAEAESLAASLAKADVSNLRADSGLQHHIGSHQITLQGGFAVVYQNGRAIAAYNMPQDKGQPIHVKPWLQDEGAVREANQSNQPLDVAILDASHRSDQPIFSIGDTDYALGSSWVKDDNNVVVGIPMPFGMSATIQELQEGAESYWTLYRSRRLIRSTYMLLLLMITSLAFFAASWLALHLSKQVTRPVEALADAMDEIAAGHYGHRVAASATQELGELVRTFNQMASDLESSRTQAESSTMQLSAANAALEVRRRELETLLETIPNGVVTLDEECRILQANRAFSELVDPGGQQPFIGLPLQAIFPAEVSETLDRLVRRSLRMGMADSELEIPSPGNQYGETLNLVATVAPLESILRGKRVQRGYVLVLEDVTELLRAQKQTAWKQVAQRVAHEIKNPLTPISLSAERIRRHIARLPMDTQQSDSANVIMKCSEVIQGSVESLRSLVDQFATLAEFPTARPRPADLSTIVEAALMLFAGRLQDVRIHRNMALGLPLVMVDPEALKRALANLVDNAAEAMQDCLLRELRVSATLLEGTNMVELVIADTGHGLTEEMRERLFLPYFSTKQRGTGLGLAIAAKIVQEHHGNIRGEKNEPVGARFIIELPVAGSDASNHPQPEAVLLRTQGNGERT
jgi:nitrogen fixation/metabolism regulation signal transduction histidine kinase